MSFKADSSFFIILCLDVSFLNYFKLEFFRRLLVIIISKTKIGWENPQITVQKCNSQVSKLSTLKHHSNTASQFQFATLTTDKSCLLALNLIYHLIVWQIILPTKYTLERQRGKLIYGPLTCNMLMHVRRVVKPYQSFLLFP